MKIRQARKIIRTGRFDPSRWGPSHRLTTHGKAMKRVEQWLGGYAGIVAAGHALGYGALNWLRHPMEIKAQP